jgi:hypothetical protein
MKWLNKAHTNCDTTERIGTHHVLHIDELAQTASGRRMSMTDKEKLVELLEEALKYAMTIERRPKVIFHIGSMADYILAKEMFESSKVNDLKDENDKLRDMLANTESELGKYKAENTKLNRQLESAYEIIGKIIDRDAFL